jgi:uncharacterized protein HemX
MATVKRKTKANTKKATTRKRRRPATKKNVKKGQEGFIFPASLVAVLAIVGILGVSYLFIDNLCENKGNEIKRLEAKNEQLSKDISQETRTWARLTSYESICAQLKRFDLIMAYPKDSQVVRVTDALPLLPVFEEDAGSDGLESAHLIKKPRDGFER